MDQPPGSQPPATPPPATPPPASPPPPMPSGGPTTRPGMITAVAVLEFISAGFAIMISVVALAGGALFAGAANEIESQTGVDAAAAIGGIFIVLAVIMIAIAALQIYAGVQVLKLRERGRMISLVLSIISVAMSVLQLGGENQGSVVVGLALNGFIIYACMTQKDAFSQQGI